MSHVTERRPQQSKEARGGPESCFLLVHQGPHPHRSNPVWRCPGCLPTGAWVSGAGWLVQLGVSGLRLTAHTTPLHVDPALRNSEDSGCKVAADGLEQLERLMQQQDAAVRMQLNVVVSLVTWHLTIPSAHLLHGPLSRCTPHRAHKPQLWMADTTLSCLRR